ncbi:MAG: hypothetical protein IJD60_02640 [Clostridia bacterium]|nr:hypothetical protein [Clostridia bacterium]
MQCSSPAQKLTAPGWAASDPEFTAEFYEPYEAAAHTALLLIDHARAALSSCHPAQCVIAVTYRLKSPASIRDKLLKKGLPASAAAAGAALHDVAGLRVVLSSERAVYRFASLLRLSPVELIDTHDYIAAPKPSGYRSLHLLLRIPVCIQGHAYMTPIEIQLRTASMDTWASIEHEICYKPCFRT